MTVTTASYEMAKQYKALSEFLAKPGDTVALMHSRTNDLNFLVAKDEENEMLTLIHLTDDEVISLRRELREVLSLKCQLSMSDRVN